MNLDEVLADLKEKYIQDLPAAVAKLKTLLNNSSNKEINEEFHKLKGTGLSYGLPEVSQLGKEIEALYLADSNGVSEYQAKAISLLEKITEKRLENEALDLEEESDFVMIRDRLKQIENDPK